MFAPSFLSTVLLALTVSATPILTIRDSPISLAVSRRITPTGPQGLIQHDVERAQALRTRGQTNTNEKRDWFPFAPNSPATNQAVSYVAHVGVGTPPTYYDLIIDTGSSNTWVGANKTYTPTSSSVQTSQSISVTYGSGQFNGTEYDDTVTIGEGLVINGQSIGVASASKGFSGVDGIIGIGPVDLTSGTLSPDSGATIPTVTDNLFSQGTIPAHMIGVSFEPTTEASVTNGQITWGGTDMLKYIPEITWTPITQTSPASHYWGIDQSITYGRDNTNILSTTAGIVDTGTTLILIASDAFKTYQTVTGGTPDSDTGLLILTPANFAKLENLHFHIGGSTFELTPNAQIWPRSLNSAIGGTAGGIYLIVADSGSDSGSGLDFLNGQTWLERFYSVYDTANSRVGIAQTWHTYDETN